MESYGLAAAQVGRIILALRYEGLIVINCVLQETLCLKV